MSSSGKCAGFIVGPSGIGKGYGVGRVILEHGGGHVFVTGDWCRANKEAIEHASAGELAPDMLIVDAVKEDYLSRGCPNNYFVDCPRKVEQAEALIEFFHEHGVTFIVTWYLYASREVCVERIKERAIRQGRPDDAKSSVIDRRLDTYFVDGGIRDTVIPYLKDPKRSQLFIGIDASVPLEKIAERVVRALPYVFQNSFEGILQAV